MAISTPIRVSDLRPGVRVVQRVLEGPHAAFASSGRCERSL
jgi:hypothetical protein